VEGQPWRKPADQKAVWREAERLGEVGIVRRSVYEVVDDPATRVLVIGGDIAAGGESFIRSHPQQIAWLESQGVSVEEAIHRHRDWKAREMADPFWK